MQDMLPKVVHSQKKRVGRGAGSGKGKTSGRGHKGQNSRSGSGHRYAGFEGGQTRLTKRLPKFPGFKNPFKKHYQVVNLTKLEKLDDGTEVTVSLLRENGYISDTKGLIKILGDGQITKKLTINCHKVSKKAEEQITKAGGKIVILEN